jgi:hypothetical protein
MQIKPPQVGQTYVSRTEPSLSIYVVHVSFSETDGNSESAFVVEGCDPAYKDDTMNADGCEITSDVWAEHDFSLVTE